MAAKTLDYAALSRRLFHEGGFTVSLTGESPSEGYAVSAPGHERTYPALDFTPETIRRYAAEQRSALSDPGAYLGAWRDGNTVYLDVSHVLSSLKDAVALGNANHQLAIYDLATGDEIPLTRQPGAIDGAPAVPTVETHRDPWFKPGVGWID